jgi:phosphoserine/homoserine phosphotransferase
VLEIIAAGDSFNDLGMIRASKAGFLFRAPEGIRKDNQDLPAFETYADFFDGICKAL